MTEREPDLLPELTPPPGGLARLRVRRDALQPASLFGWPASFATAGFKAYGPLLAGACTAMLLIVLWPQKLPATLATDRLIGARSTENSFRLLDDGTAAQQLASQQPGVRLYWTDSLQTSQAERTSP